MIFGDRFRRGNTGVQRNGNGLKFDKLVTTTSAPVSVDFGNDHLYVAGATTVDSFAMHQNNVTWLDGTTWLELAGGGVPPAGSTAQVGVVSQPMPLVNSPPVARRLISAWPTPTVSPSWRRSTRTRIEHRRNGEARRHGSSKPPSGSLVPHRPRPGKQRLSRVAYSTRRASSRRRSVGRFLMAHTGGSR